MNLLINEPPLIVLPSLAMKVGVNPAIFIQQLHYKLLSSNNVRNGYKWVYNSYSDWKKIFPFWSEKTIKRIIRSLENDGYVISTDEFNKLKVDKTKWYRLNYEKLDYEPTAPNGPTIGTSCPHGEGQLVPSDGVNLSPPITKDIKNNKDNVEKLDIVREIVNYLNEKAHKNYRPTTDATKRKIIARLNEGFTVEDFKAVIDVKCRDWLNNPDMNKYLRPETLFGSKFEAYLNEAPKKVAKTQQPTYQPPTLDFRAGEDL